MVWCGMLKLVSPKKKLHHAGTTIVCFQIVMTLNPVSCWSVFPLISKTDFICIWVEFVLFTGTVIVQARGQNIRAHSILQRKREKVTRKYTQPARPRRQLSPGFLEDALDEVCFLLFSRFSLLIRKYCYCWLLPYINQLLLQQWHFCQVHLPSYHQKGKRKKKVLVNSLWLNSGNASEKLCLITTFPFFAVTKPLFMSYHINMPHSCIKVDLDKKNAEEASSCIVHWTSIYSAKITVQSVELHWAWGP